MLLLLLSVRTIQEIFFTIQYYYHKMVCEQLYAERGISLRNEYYNRYNKDTDKEATVKEQQVFPGPPFQPGGPPQMGRPGAGRQPQPFTPPGMGGQGPSSPPPNFTPQLPGMEGQPLGGPGPAVQFGGERGGRPGFFRPPMDFRRCLNRFTFVWLFNGNSFWFYPVNIRRNSVEGFRWRRNRWEFERINVNRILFFRCF